MLEDLLSGAGDIAKLFGPIAKKIGEAAGPLLDGLSDSSQTLMKVFLNLITSLGKKDGKDITKGKTDGKTKEPETITEEETEVVVTTEEELIVRTKKPSVTTKKPISTPRTVEDKRTTAKKS